jgi:hypothetical protein
MDRIKNAAFDLYSPKNLSPHNASQPLPQGWDTLYREA